MIKYEPIWKYQIYYDNFFRTRNKRYHTLLINYSALLMQDIILLMIFSSLFLLFSDRKE